MGVKMEDLLNKYQHYFPEISQLYDYQKVVLNQLNSKANTLAIIPTGGGKSLLYQITSLELEGLTLVISPLIALMEEQVNELNKRGIKSLALNSNLTFVKQREILRDLRNSNYKLIYISPERLQNPFFRACLITSGITISMVVVDEAHCISQWGGGFRPDYNQIPEFLAFLNDNSRNPFILCLTATLAVVARNDIANAFKVRAENIYVTESVIRDNLKLHFQKVDLEEEKDDYLRDFLNYYKPAKTIAYLYSKQKTKQFARSFKNDFKTAYYNADVDPDKKSETYRDYVNNKIDILFATTAFGMGINIPDIESVVHIHIPNSIEEYYQQAGRGWRRKDIVKNCNCLALWSEKNFKERWRDLQNQKYNSDEIFNAYKSLVGSAKIKRVGQVVNKSKDTLLTGKEYNLQLLKYKLEKYCVIKTLGELNGTPETIKLHHNTPLWNRIIKSAADGMDSFRYVCDDLALPLTEVIDHLYQQDLINNIKTLPAMKKDVYFEILQLELPKDIAEKIALEINEDVDYRIGQLNELKELFMGENVHEILNKNLN